MAHYYGRDSDRFANVGMSPSDLRVIMKRKFRLKPLAAGLALAGCPWLCAAASLTVDSAADDGPGSLRAVLAEANATAGDPHDIYFDLPPATTITLTSGQLEVTRSVHFHGPGADELSISGNQQSRIFNIESTEPLVATISGMTVTDGRVDDSLYGQSGGGIRASGHEVRVELVDSVISGNEHLQSDGGGISLLGGAEMDCLRSHISDNSAGGAGGAVFSSLGDIKLVNCQVSDNTAQMAGGIWLHIGHLAMTEESVVSGNMGTTGGGGILLQGYADDFFGGYPASARIVNSLITANNSGGGGGCIAGYFADIEIEESVISLCQAESNGGGINVQGSTDPFVLYGELNIVDSEVSGNQAGAYGGGIHSVNANVQIAEARIEDNESDEYGGGLALRSGSRFEISDTVITGNKAISVSALWASGQREYSSLLASQVVNNEAVAVGTVLLEGGDGAFALIRDTLISGNVAPYGLAGLLVGKQVFYLENSTIADNQSINEGSGSGHALSIGYLSEASVQHVTIAFNETGDTSDSSSAAVQIGPDAQVSFDNTLIVHNTNASDDPEFSQIARHGTATVSGRHNLVTHLPTNLFNGVNLNNQVETNPRVMALADNGGRNRTVALQADSPAIDAGIELLDIEFDQRGPGFPRVFGAGPDIGAFELGPMELGDEIFSDRFEPYE